MTTMQIISAPTTYKNAGQQLQVDYIFTLTGIVTKADNIAYTVSGDYNGTQIKSARATICKGRNLLAHLANDAATDYAYITKERVAYHMNRAEYIEFVETFGTITRDSEKNGGQEKIRLKSEGKAMIEWLKAHA